MDVVREYMLATQFHGLRFLVEKGRHWTERLFWLICICASWVFCYILILYSWRNYQNNSLSFGTDTDYIKWNTSFFSVSVCEFKNKDKIYAVGQELNGEGSERNYNLDEVLLDIAYFKGDHYFLKSVCSGPQANPLCPENDLKKFSEKARSNCSEIFESCAWNNKSFNCCHYFHRLETERGPCFSINSKQTKNQTKFPLISNRLTGPGSLSLEINVQATVHIHAAEEVPTLNAHGTEFVTAKKNTHQKRVYTITEIVNAKSVQSVTPEKRKCRFPEENNQDVYKYYGYSACIVDCRINKQLSLCNCTSHLSPGVAPEKICNLSGLLCLMTHYVSYSVLINPWSQRDGFKCNCLPSCTEPEYEMVVEFESVRVNSGGHAIVELSLQQLPSLRLKRAVVRGTLDLVVSMGGAVGLFVGASLLSFVELFYFFTIRCSWTKYNKYKERNANARSHKEGRIAVGTIYHPYFK